MDEQPRRRRPLVLPLHRHLCPGQPQAGRKRGRVEDEAFVLAALPRHVHPILLGEAVEAVEEPHQRRADVGNAEAHGAHLDHHRRQAVRVHPAEQPPLLGTPQRREHQQPRPRRRRLDAQPLVVGPQRANNHTRQGTPPPPLLSGGGGRVGQQRGQVFHLVAVGGHVAEHLRRRDRHPS